jgi:hypothetical protein
MDELVSMAQSFTGLPMDSLIGGPLNAAATANAAMALTQTKFMLDTCFNIVKGDGKTTADNYTPIMINMSLTRGVMEPAVMSPDGTSVTTPAKITTLVTAFNLPLLTIIPLNSLAVDTVDIGFEMEVKSSYSEDTAQSKSTEIKAETSFEAKIGWGPVSVTVKGSASYDSKDSSTHNTHYEKSNSAKYTVNVHAGQLPLPKGVNIIIEAFAQSISPLTMPAPFQPAGGGK